MSFLIYFFVLLVSAASVLFGLDLMTSPLPRTPNVPIGRSVQVATTPVPQARRKKAADARALTPVRPAVPAPPKVEAHSGAAPQPEAKMSTPTQVAPLAPASVASVAPTPAQQPAPASSPPPAAPTTSVAQASASTPTQAAAQPPATQPPAMMESKTAESTEPVSAKQLAPQQASNSCNVRACGAAYHSFRASDCTYQPYEGERRACTIASGTVTAAATPQRASKPQAQSREAMSRDELHEVERIVKRPPLSLQPQVGRARAGRDEMSEVERIVRRMTRDETGDIPVQDADGRIFIVRKSYR